MPTYEFEVTFRVDLKNEKQADKLLDKLEERISDYARLEELADGSLFSAGYEEAKDA